MAKFFNQDHPITDQGVKDALDQDVIAPLQGMSGGTFPLGAWRRYLLSSLVWAPLTAGSVLTYPKNVGHLALTRVGDDTMIVTIDCPTAGFTIATADTAGLLMQLPAGVRYICRNPVGGVLTSLRGPVGLLLIYNFTSGVVENGYVESGNVSIGGGVPMVFRRFGGNFVAGNTYAVIGQWAMEVTIGLGKA